MDETEPTERLGPLRDAIDAIDEQIVRALAERRAVVRAMREAKIEGGAARLDPAREAEVRARWSAVAARHGVPEPLAHAVLAAVLDDSRALVCA